MSGLISAPSTREHFVMLFESAHVRRHGRVRYRGTPWFGSHRTQPVNASTTRGSAELDSALVAIEGNSFLNALVVRSAKPAGFCAGLHPGVANVFDRAAFAARGQRVLSRLAALPFTTVAFIDGPCIGAGLELALACDHRLCVATPTTHRRLSGSSHLFGGGPPPALLRYRRRARRISNRSARFPAARPATLVSWTARSVPGARRSSFGRFSMNSNRLRACWARVSDETSLRGRSRHAFAGIDFAWLVPGRSEPPTHPAVLLLLGVSSRRSKQSKCGARIASENLLAAPSERAPPFIRRAA